ncbi:MAG: ABC transporter ATP-binding protein [Pseudomonadota bacterium]
MPAARPAEPARLEARDLRKRFGDRVALDGVSFNVAPGEIVGLLGPNGAGKTTAFRLLAGLLPPDGGAFFFDGQAAQPTRPAYRRRLGVVFQDASLDLKLTGRENLALGAALFGLSRRTAARRIDEALDLMQLGARADEPAARYSGGMRRRVEIARVLLHDPDLLLLDEPGRGVDPEALRRIWDQIESLRARRGLSVIVTTHQPEEAERCARVAVLDAGRIVATGSPDELRARVSGDVVRVEADAPDEIAATLTARLNLVARVVDGRVCVEAPRGHALVPRVVELFPAGRLRSVATARPTLADVFAHITGRGLDEKPTA